MKLLIIDPFSESFLKILEQEGHDVVYLPNLNRTEILEQVANCELLILNSRTQINAELIDKAPNLKGVIRAGVGLDHFDLPYLQKKGIEAVNTAGANADSVAEHTIGMLFSLCHKIQVANTQVKQFIWNREANRGIEIKGKTVGIIGYGHTGSAVAQRLNSFGCKILVYDKYKDVENNKNICESNWAEIQAEADILSLHIPLTPETHHLLNKTYFANFRKPIIFLNLARGEILHTPDLIWALNEKKVLAAGLDVLENEKFDSLNPEQIVLYQQLFQFENVIVTPHIGGWSVESKQNIETAILKWVQAWKNKVSHPKKS